MRSKRRMSLPLRVFVGGLVLVFVGLGALILTDLRDRAAERKALTVDDAAATSTIQSFATTTPTESAATTTEAASDESDYLSLGYCRDADATHPYYTRSFIGGFTYKDGSPVVDICIEEGEESTRLIEFSCDSSELVQNTYRCQYGCFDGACMSQPLSASFTTNALERGTIAWTDTGIQFDLVTYYVGDMTMPPDTSNPNGSTYTIGEHAYALVLVVEARSGGVEACVPISMQRVVDESGARVDANTRRPSLQYTGGCTLPADTTGLMQVVFVIPTDAVNAVIDTGGDTPRTIEFKRTDAGWQIQPEISEG